jgi:hypothetical protein
MNRTFLDLCACPIDFMLQRQREVTNLHSKYAVRAVRAQGLKFIWRVLDKNISTLEVESAVLKSLLYRLTSGVGST